MRIEGPSGGKRQQTNPTTYTTQAGDTLHSIAAAHGVKVSNNSWGGGGFTQSLFDAINAAKSVGHIFCAAAGNVRLFERDEGTRIGRRRAHESVRRPRSTLGARRKTGLAGEI